jgi:ribosomal protein L16/L10AE
VPDTRSGNKEYKVLMVEDETVLLEVRGVEDGQEAWKALKSMPISKLEARIDSWSLEVSTPA